MRSKRHGCPLVFRTPEGQIRHDFGIGSAQLTADRIQERLGCPLVAKRCEYSEIRGSQPAEVDPARVPLEPDLQLQIGRLGRSVRSSPQHLSELVSPIRMIPTIDADDLNASRAQLGDLDVLSHTVNLDGSAQSTVAGAFEHPNCPVVANHVRVELRPR